MVNHPKQCTVHRRGEEESAARVEMLGDECQG